MPVSKTQSRLSVITFTGLVNSIKAHALNAGFSSNPFDEFQTEEGETIIVYEVVKNPNKLMGKAFLAISIVNYISDFAVKQRLYESWDNVNHTGTGNGAMTNQFIVADSESLAIETYSSSEFNLINLHENQSEWCLLGVVYSANSVSYWDEDIACKILIPDTYDSLANFYGNGSVPYSGALSGDFATSSSIRYFRNPFNNGVDVIPRLYIAPYSGEGNFGATSADLVRLCDNSLSFTDVVISGDRTYTCIGKSNEVVYGLRIV